MEHRILSFLMIFISFILFQVVKNDDLWEATSGRTPRLAGVVAYSPPGDGYNATERGTW